MGKTNEKLLFFGRGGGGGIDEQFALDVTLNLSGGKLKIPPKKIAQNRTSVAKGWQYTADRTSYWSLREGWIRKTCPHKEKAQDLTEAYVPCLVLYLACSQTFFFLFFFFDYLVSAWAKWACDSERGRKTKGYFLLSPAPPLALAVYKSPAVFFNFLRALYDLERETGESVNRLSNANHGTVITLYMSSCTGSVISYNQTIWRFLQE